MADALVVRLAREELVYLLRALAIPAIATLEPGPLITLEGEQLALALAVADRTLRARGMVRWGGAEQRTPDPVIVGLLRALGNPGYTLILDVRRTVEAAQPGGRPAQASQPIAQRLVYTFATYAAIEHTHPEPGVHQFVALATAQDAFLRLLQFIEVTDSDDAAQNSASTPGQGQAGERPIAQGEISLSVLGEMNRLLAAGDAAGAQKALASHLSATLAQGLIGALMAPRSFTQFGLWPGLPLTINPPAGQAPSGATEMGQLTPIPPMATLVVAQAQDGDIYTLTQGEVGSAQRPLKSTHSAQVKVAQVTADQARAAMANILNPALAVVKTGSQADVTADNGNSAHTENTGNTGNTGNTRNAGPA